jgi:hypothetical protein
MTLLHHSFESAMLSSADYDTETKELTVTFTGGKSYTYVDVDRSDWEDLINAKSAGRHFNSIKSALVQKK